MSLEKKLVEKYSLYGYISGGELYLPIVWAIKFVEECTLLNVAVIGIEFFHLKETMVIPVSPINGLDCSGLLDRNQSWENVIKRCNQAAMEVLEEEKLRDDNQYCNITIFEEQDR